jgi:hypothetical protein
VDRFQDRSDRLISNGRLLSPQVRGMWLTFCMSCGCFSRARSLLSVFMQLRVGAKEDPEARLKAGEPKMGARARGSSRGVVLPGWGPSRSGFEPSL